MPRSPRLPGHMAHFAALSGLRFAIQVNSLIAQHKAVQAISPNRLSICQPAGRGIACAKARDYPDKLGKLAGHTALNRPMERIMRARGNLIKDNLACSADKSFHCQNTVQLHRLSYRHCRLCAAGQDGFVYVRGRANAGRQDAVLMRVQGWRKYTCRPFLSRQTRKLTSAVKSIKDSRIASPVLISAQIVPASSADDTRIWPLPS